MTPFRQSSTQPATPDPGERHQRMLVAVLVACVTAATWLSAQQGPLTPAEQQRRHDLEDELQSIAIVERKVMVPMRDGVRLATDIYRPRNATGPVPIVFSKTPYNFNYWDVRNRVPADMSTPIAAVKRGYAYVVQNERGHFFSEGNYDILGAPVTDGYDAIDWLTRQSWSNGKVGTTGCSSTAEWQPAVASLGHPGFAAMNIQGFGAGVGRVGPYFEQGNWYRGGAIQMLFITWLYGEQNQVRPQFPMETSREDLVAASRLFDLAPQMPPVDWGKALWHLPVQDIMKEAEGPRGIFADKMAVPTGGAMVRRTAQRSGLVQGWPVARQHAPEPAWAVVHVVVRRFGRPESRDVQPCPEDRQAAGRRPAMGDHRAGRPTVPTLRATADTIVGERSMGDARLDYNEIVYGFFDKFLKGDGKTRLDAMPRVTYFTMGSNKWQTSETWPPTGAQPRTFYLSSGGRANSLYGDGVLQAAAPATDVPGCFRLRPAQPRRLLRR